MSVIKYNKKSLLKCAKDIEAFAKAELLEAHAKSIEIRRMDK
jgi:histidinol dehydrogenase